MKQHIILLLSLLCLTINVRSQWVETCGTSVEQSGTYWPYVSDYTGFDHSDECTYTGSYATIRYLDRYSAYGPHIYLASGKDCIFTINNIPGGEQARLSFDIVPYQSGATDTDYANTDIISVDVNGELLTIASTSLSTTSFTTVDAGLLPEAETYSISFSKPASDASQVRIDNITITYGDNHEGGSNGNCPYGELNGLKGSELLSALHQMIAEHHVLSYDEVRADRARVDFRSDGTLWDIYSECEFYSSDYCNNTNYNTTVECDCYNREHIVPISFWGSNKDAEMYTDLHHVLPSDNATNAKRGAWAFGEVTGSVEWSNSLGTKLGYSSAYNKTVFEPADEYKGDIARIYFYMITCYLDRNFTIGGQGYKMFTWSGGTAGFSNTTRSQLIKWHRNDPVSQKEQNRNDAVEYKQANRNPFVDDPELAEHIWGSKSATPYSCTTTDINETIPDAPTFRKVFEDNNIYIILEDGTKYNILGIKVQ